MAVGSLDWRRPENEAEGMAHFSLSAVGADRPGIVAAVTQVLTALGCNLEDSSMTILRGQFAIMLVVAAPDGVDSTAIEQSLSAVAERLDLTVSVRPMSEEVPAPALGEVWAVSVHGADRPGIVHSITSALASAGANVVDLSTRVLGDPAAPGYLMLLSVVVPFDIDAGAVASELRQLGDDLGVACSMHPAEADIL